MEIYLAEFETMTIKAQGYGHSVEAALHALIQRWQGDWVRVSNADPNLLSDSREDIRLFAIELDKGYVYGSPDSCAYPFLGLASESRYDRLFNAPDESDDSILRHRSPIVRRRIQLLQPLPYSIVDNTFEGWLLYDLIGNDFPAKKGSANSIYLGSSDVAGEGFINFACNLDDLERFIERAEASKGRTAKRLLPFLRAGFEKQELDPVHSTNFWLSDITDSEEPDAAPLTIFDVVQDMMQQYPNLPEEFVVRTQQENVTEYVRVTRDDITIVANPNDQLSETRSPGL